MRASRRVVAAALVAAALVPTAAAAQRGTTAASPEAGPVPPISFGFVGRYTTGLASIADELTAAETVALAGDRLYVTNATFATLDVVDIANPAVPMLLHRVDLRELADVGDEEEVTSVAVSGNAVAVAVRADPKTDPGVVLVFERGRLDTALDPSQALIGTAPVGANPDALSFTPDGKRIVVANEGEPESYLVGPAGDPEGTVSIITLPPGQRRSAGNRTDPLPVRTVTFADFNEGGPRHGELEGVRIFGPNATVAQDLEPEYVAISPDGRAAYVTLQENNAIAVLSLPSGEIRAIKPLGYQNFGVVPLDASDRDSAINIRTWSNVFGMYQPDQVAAFSVGGRTYLLSANEGDARTDWPGLDEEESARNVTSDASFPNRANSQVGRLNVTTATPASPAPQSTLYAFGGRSYSVWDADVNQVWDSKDQLERLTAQVYPANFNSNNSANNFDNRSDNKGPEPEGVTTGVIGGRTYGFVGLERQGGVVVTDLTEPGAPVFQQYLTTRDFGSSTVGPDSGPEGLAFVNDGPGGQALLAVGNETTGTVTLFAIS